MNRRKFLAAMAAGAIVTAEGLWIPGQKLISIPKVGDGISLTSMHHPHTDDIIMPGINPQELWPGIDKWFALKYKEFSIRS